MATPKHIIKIELTGESRIKIDEFIEKIESLQKEMELFREKGYLVEVNNDTQN